MSNLSGKIIFITGASRGIGRSIALRAAEDGANIVIVAKTTEPHPKLPGTIYTVAEEGWFCYPTPPESLFCFIVERAGGKALPIAADIRNEEDVRDAVKETDRTFGYIDILINNASAISLTNTVNTSMKSYDLMNSINTRGTFLCSKLCIPLMKYSANPHILNLCPPLNLNPQWFMHNLAYTLSKYGMSMCTLGLARELRTLGIAVNALWPRTAIYTAATRMLAGKSFAAKCRHPEIMSDAAYTILNMSSRDPKNSGNFFVDEDLLRSFGENDFDKYAMKQGSSLALDYFLDEYSSATERLAAGEQQETDALPTVDIIFQELQKNLSSYMVQQVGASFYFNLSGSEPGRWYINLTRDNGSMGKVEHYEVEKYNTRFDMSSEDFAKMFAGKLIPMEAAVAGQIKIDGDLFAATRFGKMAKNLNLFGDICF